MILYDHFNNSLFKKFIIYCSLFAGCSIRQEDSAELYYDISGVDIKSITTKGGWNLSVSQIKGHDSIFLDIDKKNFDSKYIYHVNIIIHNKEPIGYSLILQSLFKSSCIYSGNTIRKDIVSKKVHAESTQTLYLKLEYWKVQK